MTPQMRRSITVFCLAGLSCCIPPARAAPMVQVHEPVQGPWVDAQDLGVRGRAFAASECALPYDRLPSSAEHAVTAAVWNLQHDSAGQFVQFVSNASFIAVNITYLWRGQCSMWHFPSTGVCGLDLYAWDPSESARRWRWVDTTHANGPIANVNVLTALPGRSLQRYRLHLPLYNAPAALHLAPQGAGGAILRDTTYQPAGRPIVWYGTSIAQGGVVTRPGMAFTNIIARNLGREVLNFGFSGNGKMALEVAANLTSIDAALIVVDCNWNMNGESITANLLPLVRYFRSHGHASTPIVLAEGTQSGQYWVEATARSAMDAKAAALRAGYNQLVAAGEADDVHYVSRSALYNMSFDGGSLISPTVGGCHPTDLGQLAVADFYTTFLPPLLAKQDARAGYDTGAGAEARTGMRYQHRSVVTASASALEAARKGGEALHARFVRETVARDGHDAAQGDGDLPKSAMRWVSVDGPGGLGVTGRAFPAQNSSQPGAFFTRLPTSAKGIVRDAVWDLAQDATGVAVPFVTNSSTIALEWSMTSACAQLWHMPASGACGADLFRWDPNATEQIAGSAEAGKGAYRFVNAANVFPTGTSSTVFTFSTGLDPPPAGAAGARYLLFLALRGRVGAASVGVAPGSSLARDPAFDEDGVTMHGRKPIVWYGTSIDQGGVASRPGSTYTNILTRALRRNVLNMGFAGNGVMELSVARFLATIDAAAIVIDCLPNMSPEMVTNRTAPIVHYFRSHGHPTTPIVLAAGTTYGDHWFSPSGNDNKRAALKAEYDKLVGAGDEHLHLVLDAKEELFGSNPYISPTVGGTHPSDLGHREIANFYAAYLPPLLDS